MSAWIVLTYLETIPERLAPDEMLAAVPAKIWRHHFVQAVQYFLSILNHVEEVFLRKSKMG
jgi:hypothetical protein